MDSIEHVEFLSSTRFPEITWEEEQPTNGLPEIDLELQNMVSFCITGGGLGHTACIMFLWQPESLEWKVLLNYNNNLTGIPKSLKATRKGNPAQPCLS